MLPFTRKKLQEWAGPDIFRRAESIVDSHRVFKVELRENVISGMVEARPRDILCEMAFSEKSGLPENRCPCRDSREMGLICVHVVSLCLAHLEIMNDPVRLAKLEEEKRKAERMAKRAEGQLLDRVPPGTPGAVAVELKLRFPVHAPEQWITGETPVEPLIGQKGQFRSISEVKPGYKLAMSGKQDNILFILEDIAEGPVPGTLLLKPVDLENLFAVMTGEAFLLGAKQVRVDANYVASRIRMDLEEESGELILDLECDLPDDVAHEVPYYFVHGRKAWVWAGSRLLPMAKLMPGPLQDMYRAPVRIPRLDVPRFMREELDALRSMVMLETGVSPEWFSFEPATPVFRLLVKGSPASLSATLYARYGDREVVAASKDAADDVVVPDLENILHYQTRNREAEKQALSRLVSIGFPGERGDRLEAIVGKATVMSFCASSLPMLRRRGWRVELEGRIEQAFEESDTVVPVVNIQSGSQGENWFDVDCSFETNQGESLSLKEIRAAMKRGESHIQRGDRMLLFDRDAVDRMVSVFDDCGSESDKAGSVRMNSLYGAYLKSSLDALDGVDVEAAPEWLQNAEQQNKSAKLEPIEIGDRVQATLRPYQDQGVSWLRYLERAGFSGILADEMGLGKTLQTLCWLQLLREKPDARNAPVLIVCPTSLVENWIEEGQKFVPHLKFLNLTGAQREKSWKTADKADVWVTSYAIVRRDLKKYLEFHLSVVVLDEAQHIKNRSTQNSQAVKQLHAHHRLVLTGTPVENSVSDLWSIMDFLMPGYLGTHETFRHKYELPIRDGGDEGEDAQKRLQRKIHPFLLRRLKKDVAKDLPPKIEKVAHCSMTSDQSLVYKELVRQSQEKVENLVATKGFDKCRMEILTVLLRLRQACCHLELLKMEGLESKAPSGKLELFKEMMQEAVDGGHRVLVFSQFTSMLRILERELQAMELKCCYLDGSTKNRMDQVRLFQGDESYSAFLISLKAGGTGLNLTGADMVIHYDPWWNPAVEAQATDRAYRIGQQRTVYSVKMITKDSVEEKVLALQRRKQAVIDATLDSDSQLAKSLDWDDVQELLRI